MKNKDNSSIQFFYNEGDYFAPYVNEALLSLDKSLHEPLDSLFTILKKIQLAKPNKKFEEATSVIIINIIGVENYRIISRAIIEMLIESEVITEQFSNKKILIDKYNADIFKNFLFSTIPVLDNTLIDTIKKLVVKHYELIPSIANASIYTISRYKENYSISALSVIRSKVKQRQAQKLIDKYITEIANNRGITVYELEDISVPDFGLIID